MNVVFWQILLQQSAGTLHEPFRTFCESLSTAFAFANFGPRNWWMSCT